MAEEDPLVQALPPATDYLTYLTLLEYQLTPARLPLLHKLLQDETLTTNIGWDLVHLLLPMLPQSLDCLQDIARLGNPREVILRVSEALMQLQPSDDDDDDDDDDEHNADDGSEASPVLPRHVRQFNCLVAMLSTLHSRIQTKYPSRFIATSLQAALEAYTLFPTNETTTALVEFFRDVSPSKRPAPPPRAASESSVVRVSQASAPDPEAEAQSPSPNTDNEKELVKKYLQFGLMELLKSFLLSLSGPTDPGMSWTGRVLEKLHPESQIANKQSQTDLYASTKELRERDMIIGKVMALSRDLGLSNEQLLSVVSLPPGDQPSPLDFDDLPKTPDGVPFERHGALLLLTARAATTVLFSSGSEAVMLPDLPRLFVNFIGDIESLDEVAFGQPQVLLDSLLALTVLSTARQSVEAPADPKEFKDFLIRVTACSSRQSYTTVRRIPAAIFHSHPSELVRFKVLRHIFETDRLHSARETAVGWLKDEILTAAKGQEADNDNKIFLNPHYFSVLFPFLFNPSEILLDVHTEIVASWLRFSQTLTPTIHAALNLYYILVSSARLRTELQLEKTYLYFRGRFLEPLKSICHAFECDLVANGGDGRLEAAVGEDLVRIGMARSVGIITHIVGQVDEAVNEAFAGAEAEMQEPSMDDIARVDAIRKDTLL